MAEPRQEPRFAAQTAEPRPAPPAEHRSSKLPEPRAEQTTEPQPQRGFAPQVVASTEQAVAARRGPRTPSGTDNSDARAAEQLLSAMRTVKSARFNAADRLERKHTLSMFAMSM